MVNSRQLGRKIEVSPRMTRTERNSKTGWRRIQSHANFSPSNSLLTGKNTGNWYFLTRLSADKSQSESTLAGRTGFFT